MDWMRPVTYSEKMVYLKALAIQGNKVTVNEARTIVLEVPALLDPDADRMLTEENFYMLETPC